MIFSRSSFWVFSYKCLPGFHFPKLLKTSQMKLLGRNFWKIPELLDKAQKESLVISEGTTEGIMERILVEISYRTICMEPFRRSSNKLLPKVQPEESIKDLPENILTNPWRSSAISLGRHRERIPG